MIKVFAVLMSLQLIIAPVAIAQTAGDQFRANPDAKPSGDYMEIIKSMALAAVGTSAVQCTMFARLPSIAVFSAASVAYIAFEQLSGDAQKDFMKSKASDIEMLKEKMKKSSGGAGEVQRETLLAALEDEKKIRDIIDNKLKGTSIVSKMMMVATGLALAEMIGEKFGLFPPFAGCSPGTMLPSQLITGQVLSGIYGLSALKSSGVVSGAATFGAAYAVSQGMLGPMITGMLNTSQTRIGAFFLASKITSDTEGKLQSLRGTVEKNIGYLESVLAEFDRNTLVSNSTVHGQPSGTNSNGVVTSGTMGGGSLGAGSSSNTLATRNLDPLANVSGEPSKNCYSNTSEGPIYSTDCKNPLQLTRPTLGPDFKVPTLRDGTNHTIDYVQAIASGDTAKANAAGASLTAMASRIDKVNSDLLKQYNDQRLKDGKAAFDLDAETAKINEQLNGAINGELKSKGADIAALSKLNVLGASGATSDVGKLEINSASSGVVAAIPGNGALTITEGLTNSEGTLSEGDVSNAPSMEETLSKYEDNQSEISDNPDESLFKQVSNRYMSNYSRFFKRKDAPPESSSEPNK